MPDLLVDLTPAGGGHGIRGIGSYVRGLGTALASDPELAARVVALSSTPVAGLKVVRPGRWLSVRPQDVGAVTGWLAEALALRRAGVRALHQGDPFRPLRPPGAARVAVTVHDLIPLEHPDPAVRPHRRRAYAAYLTSIRQADRVIAVSRTTADAVTARLDVEPERISVVPPVVLAPPQVSRQPALEPSFLFVGVPEPHKQPELAVAALASYRARHGVGRLRFIGPLFDGHRQLLDDAARRHGVADAVQVSGRVPAAELERAYATATGLLAVSRVEGFGLPPVEAALRGVPVVANDTPIARETLGRAATFAEPGADGLAAAMAASVPPADDARRELEHRYSPGTVAGALRTAYGQLLGPTS